VQGRWNESFTAAMLTDAQGDLLGWLRLQEWYDAGSRTPRVAWVADYLGWNDDESMLAVLVDDGDQPAGEQSRREALVAAAEQARDEGPPELPSPAADGAPTVDDRIDELDLLVSAWSRAHDRLFLAAERDDAGAREEIYVALTELLNWTYTIDSVLDVIWRKRLDGNVKEDASKKVDQGVSKAIAANERLFAERGETYDEPTTGVVVAFRQREQDGEPYPSWSHVLGTMAQDVDPRIFNGLKWIRGQFVHRGVLHAVDLRQWRPGAEPRWKWRPSQELGRSASGKDKESMADYDAVLAGVDVIGSLSLIDALADAVRIFSDLLHAQEAQGAGT
jgi:hypothetical protein